MASAIVAAPTDAAWLAERQIVIGARVGSCTVAHRGYGTVTAVRSTAEIVVAWDDATTETVTWSAISSLGYVAEVPPLVASPSQWASAACHLDRRADWRTVRVSGVRYVVLVSGRSDKTYFVRADGRGCGCRWYEQTGRTCSHALAVELAALEDELRAAPASESFPRCRACRAVTEDAICDPCASDQARRLDDAAKRDAFGRVIPPFVLNELVA